MSLSLCGNLNTCAQPASIGLPAATPSKVPRAHLGSIEPSPTNATRPRPGSWSRSACGEEARAGGGNLACCSFGLVADPSRALQHCRQAQWHAARMPSQLPHPHFLKLF